jgi:Lrp/AsnC family transcriptional regulator, leucine-responsive regulatory protein
MAVGALIARVESHQPSIAASGFAVPLPSDRASRSRLHAVPPPSRDRRRSVLAHPTTPRSRRRSPDRGRFCSPDPVPYDVQVLDERDLEIVAALQEDARATYADVAQRVGLSASAVHDRVRKLEQAGVIRGYRAIIDPETLGLFITALIAATPLDPKQPDDLPERLADFPQVEDCYSVAGEANYILKVRTRTTGELEDLIRLLREKVGVATRTTIALSIPFEDRPIRT